MIFVFIAAIGIWIMGIKAELGSDWKGYVGLLVCMIFLGWMMNYGSP